MKRNRNVTIDAVFELLMDGHKSPTSEAEAFGRMALVGDTLSRLGLATRGLNGVRLTPLGEEWGRAISFHHRKMQTLARLRLGHELPTRRHLKQTAYKKTTRAIKEFELKQRKKGKSET